jgi:hypothetical protein
MRWGIIHIALLAGSTLSLAGCGLADVRAPVPSFMRLKEAEPAPLEPAPDVKQMVRDHLDSVFVSSSAPHHVLVSQAYHDVRALGWTACVRADVNSANGSPLGSVTYRITINNGAIIDRMRVDADDNCMTENYEPI